MSPSPQQDHAAGAAAESAPPALTTTESSSSSTSTSPPKVPPPAPNPSTDPVLVTQATPAEPPSGEPVASPQLSAQPDDIFALAPLAALKLLSAAVEALVRVTGDIPPTPPPESPQMPNMRGMEAEKESIVRSYSERSLARMREVAERQAATAAPVPPLPAPAPTQGVAEHPPIDGVHLRPASTNLLGAEGPPAPASTPEPYVVIGANSQPLNLQHSAITRKFYSKKPPPIGIGDYLQRIHRFCPMSTAVYLATSLYIHRLAVEERAVAVTRRNAHRLLLAGLRVAMKALEDLSYPHGKMAKVGGVSEAELARLEISFCFLCGFELVVGAEGLERHWRTMRTGLDGPGMVGELTIRRPVRPMAKAEG
ncbi:PHO85 cyclin-7 [Pleurostoma richardsiae]|uniref:PHO85 cyclin-7 n=1 Tax=Pleurostoma richardsiae TaxID=41990 RepID=A0AA38R4F2_9PEZI|nr:PHO85 cyclin-7 [Pleurostoma richardsiae]